MSSPEDIFNDSSDIGPEDFTPPSSLTPNSFKSSQGAMSQPTPSQTSSLKSDSDIFDNLETSEMSSKHVDKSPTKIKIEFYDSSGTKLYARFSSAPEVISIAGSMLQSADMDYRAHICIQLLTTKLFK